MRLASESLIYSALLLCRKTLLLLRLLCIDPLIKRITQPHAKVHRCAPGFTSLDERQLPTHWPLWPSINPPSLVSLLSATALLIC